MAFRQLILILFLITLCARDKAIATHQADNPQPLPQDCQEEALTAFIEQWKQRNTSQDLDLTKAYLAPKLSVIVRKVSDGTPRTSSSEQLSVYSCGDRFEIELQVQPESTNGRRTVDAIILRALSPSTAETTGRFHIQSQTDLWELMNCKIAMDSVLIALRRGGAAAMSLRVLWNAPCNKTKSDIEFVYIAMDSTAHIYEPTTGHKLYHESSYQSSSRAETRRAAAQEQGFCTLETPNPELGSCLDHGITECCPADQALDCQVATTSTCYCDTSCFEFGDCCSDINELNCSCNKLLPLVHLLIAPESSISESTETQMGEVSVFHGAQITLTCKAQGVPIPSIQWLRDGNFIPVDSNLVITDVPINPRFPTNSTSSLTISSMSQAYVGMYTCRATNSAGIMLGSQIVSLCDVTVLPEKLNVSEGGDIQLNCKCVPPGSQVMWKHSSLGGSERIINSSSVLKLSNVGYRDSGTYSCTVIAHNLTTVALSELIVQVPPQVNLTGNATISESTGIQLHCSASGYPLPTISWFKITNDRGVVTSLSNTESPRVETRAIPNAAASTLLDSPPTVVSILNVHELYSTDGGEYVCLAQNYLIEKTVEVLSLNVTVLVKDECQETERSPCQNGGTCLDGYNMFFCQCVGHFTGYTCGGQLEGPPRQPQIVQQPQSIQANLHQMVNLSCIADGHPAPQYQWKKDGELIEGLALPFLYIHEVRPSDRAFYTCEANNSEGGVVSEIGHLSIPGVYQYAVALEFTDVAVGDGFDGFTKMVAIELVGKTMTEGITVYSIQPLKAMSNHNLTLLVTVVADSYTKDGIAELIRGEFLQLPLSPWQFMVTDIQRYDGCVAEEGVPLFPESETFRYSWVESELTEVVNGSCPCQRFRADSAAGGVARQCGGTYTHGAHWEDFGFEECGLSKIALQLCESGMSSSIGEIAQEVAMITEDTEQLDASAITVAATIITENLTTAAIEEPNVRAYYLTIVDNLVAAPTLAVQQSQLESQSSSKLLESLGDFSDLVSLSNTTNGNLVDTYTRKNFAIQVHDVDTSTFTRQAFSVVIGSDQEAVNGTDQEISVINLLVMMEAVPNATAAIQLLPSIFGLTSGRQLSRRLSSPTNSSTGRERLSYSVFLMDSLFQTEQTHNGDYKIASIIVGTRIYSYCGNNDTEDGIAVTFQTEEPLDDSAESVCAHYNPHGDNGFGSWSSSNCKVVKRSGNKVQCDCSQPAHFGLLFDLSPGETYAPGAFSLELITYIGTGLSVICLLVVIITYCISKKLRSTPHGKMLINLCLALLGLYIVFLVAGRVTSISVLCGIVAALLHYFVLVFFGWTAAEAVNLYMKLVVVLGKGTKYYVFKAALIVWLVPLVVVGISAGAGHDYYVNPFFCRATEWPFWFGLILPFVIIYAFDWVMFVMIMLSLIKKAKYRQKVKADSTGASSEVKRHLLIAVGLATVFGLGWGFGLAATSSSTKEVTFVFQLIFSIFVGFQGVLIFILHGLRSPEVRRTWTFWYSSTSSKSGTSHSGSYHRNNKRSRNATLDSQNSMRTDYSLRKNSMGSLKMMQPPSASTVGLDSNHECTSPSPEQFPASKLSETAASPPYIGSPSPLNTTAETQLPLELSMSPEVFGGLNNSPEKLSTSGTEEVNTVGGDTPKEIEHRSTGFSVTDGPEQFPVSTHSETADVSWNAGTRMEGDIERHTDEDRVRLMRAAAIKIRRLSSELSQCGEDLASMEGDTEEGRSSQETDSATNLSSPLSHTSISMEGVDIEIAPAPGVASVKEGGASLGYLDDMEILVSNPMVNQAKKISQHLHQMSEFTQDRGKLRSKEDLLAAAKDIVTSAQEILGYARLISDNCADKRNKHVLQESATALSTRSNILKMNTSRYAKDVAATNVDVLVRNTQEIMQFVIQAVEAAESACLKGILSPTGAEQEAKIFAQWKNDVYNLRRKGSVSAPQGAQGLRKAKGATLANYIQDVHSNQTFV